jgi:hypothetical protein
VKITLEMIGAQEELHRDKTIRGTRTHIVSGAERLQPPLFSQGALNFFHHQLKELQHEEFE